VGRVECRRKACCDGRAEAVQYRPAPMKSHCPAAIVALVAAFALPGRADIMLAPPFTDQAVLQRDISVPVWGRAAPGEKIAVRHRGQQVETTAGTDGRWSVRLAPMPASAAGADLVVAGANTVTLHDVVVGEVWLASGQSNMEWPLSLALEAKAEIAAAHSSLVRELHVDHSPSDLPTDTVKTGGWQIATPATAGGFSAVGYFFAQALAEKLSVPVGIIHSSWGGTPIESWLAEPVLRTTRAWPRFDRQWQQALKVFPKKMAEYPALDAAWRQADEEQRATGKPNPLAWPHPPAGPGTVYAPGGLFNGMILPLAPFALRGVIWYQGESNVGREREYRELFPAMITSWRQAWPLGDFPFYFVQLPNFSDHKPGGRKWAALREAQAAALALPHTGMAVTIDVGEAEVLHPTNKKPVGERLALLAEAQVHRLPVEASGPVFQAATREGAALRLKFSHAVGLAARARPPTGFEVAGADQVFHAASAALDGESVLVSATEVPEPVAVRYAWTNSPAASLYNGAGLPAAPFRSDAW
jgi:sialate O-acetylesterase